MKLVTQKPEAARTLEAMYRKAGLPCELDAGPVGIVVYAASAATARTIAESLAKAPRMLGVVVHVEPPVFERDEAPETAYVATVRFDWNTMPASAAAWVPAR